MSKRTMRVAPKEKTSQESIWSMFKSLFKDEKRSQRKPGMHSRSIAPAAISRYEARMEAVGLKPEEIVEDEEFFDIATSTSPHGYPKWVPPPKEGKRQIPTVKFHVAKERRPELTKQQQKEAAKKKEKDPGAPKYGVRQNKSTGKKADAGFQLRRRQAPVHERSIEEDDDEDDVGDQIVDFFNNSNRKQSGLGLVAKLLGTSGPKQGKNWKPKRPFFTFWVTIIQIITYIIVSIWYGIAPVAIDQTEVTGEVLMTSLVTEFQSYFTDGNMWIGPSNADLIHVGAKFSPCMRKDENIEEVLALDRARENETACCVRNDGGGCFQALEEDCPSSLNTWIKWTSDDPRTSGSVCGQDPDYCTNPSSVAPNEWPDDITEWPVCLEADFSSASEYHLTCELIGRPCCIGIQGECVIATQEYCDFLKGYFHEEATLCSQVYCMEEICGMIPFWNPDQPDQFYRLIVSQFLHAGIFTMVITLLFQFIVMMGLERIIGWWRMFIVYMGSGVAGCLASAIFLPYHVEAGPSGAQFGVLACLFIEVMRWNQYSSPGKTVAKLLAILVVLFLLGLLPAIDNWAHLFGLLFGFPFGLAIRPYKTMNKKELSKCQRGVFSLVCASLAVVVFVILVLIFYLYPIYACDACSYFNCLPITDTFCDSLQITIERSYAVSI